MFMVDATQSARARTALRRFFRDQPELAGEIEVLRGKYSFRELRVLADKTSGVLSVPGTVSVDLDEAVNRVRVGVESEVSRSAVAEYLTSHGVPADAVIVEVVEPFAFTSSIRDVVEGRPGGILIEFRNGYGSGDTCTLGFSARFSGLDPANTYLVTNSHCSVIQGAIDDYSVGAVTFLYQPDDYDTGYLNYAGSESHDPSFFTGGSCPAGRRCRYSDAMTYYPGYLSGPADFGRIARTAFSGRLSGSLDINPSNPRFQLTGWTNTLSGQTLQKVGATTGWTSGNVVSTCTSQNVLNTDITLLCQYQVDAGARGGDSGSPVFAGTGSTSTLRGILWGGNSTGSRYTYSPMYGIERDLGFGLVVN